MLRFNRFKPVRPIAVNWTPYSGGFCHSDFMWNQFRESRSSKNAFNCYFSGSEFYQFSKFQPLESATIQNSEHLDVLKEIFGIFRIPKIDFT